MASKFEEIFPMEIADLLSLCEDIYKPYDLIRYATNSIHTRF